MEEKRNTKLLTIICYLSYFFTGSLVTVTGVVLGPIAEFYQYKPGTISYLFTAQNGLMFVIIIVGGFLMKKFSLKNLFVFGILIEIFGLAFLQIFIDFAFSFAIFMGIIGLAGGMFMSLASFLVVRLFADPKIRSKRLVMADFFFSFSGVVLPIVVTQLLKLNIFWLVLYYLLTLVGIAMLFLITKSNFPTVLTKSENNEDLYNEKWGLPVICVALSCLFFIFAELTFSEWFPLYLQKYLNFSDSAAGNSISMFWAFMAIGLFAGRFVIQKFKLGQFIFICYSLACISLIILSIVTYTPVIIIAIITYGFFNSVIYASMISYGSLQVLNSPPTLVTFILACGTLGTMLSSPVSGFLANKFSIFAAFNSCWVLLLIGFAFFLLTFIFSKAEHIHGTLRGKET